MTVRVRFAPSPTGSPHIGNIHTALFNWLLARSAQGTFVLRVEDTDAARHEQGALRSMLDGLRWLGLAWDEGPEVNGPHAPYFQSERLELYREHIRRLVEEGKAYPCFCSAELLEARRQEALTQGKPPRYDGRCRHLTAQERTAEEQKGVRSVVRFKTPLEGRTTFVDLLRGELTFSNRDLDDTILLKSDGYPTYHLANVVDDHLMGISHVLRAEEWIPSAPRHILLYRAFGWEPPHFAHLPLILNTDRTKLSKRAGSNGLEHYRAAGYLPQAIVNYLALLGWSPPPGVNEVLTAEELVRHFAIDRLSRSASVFDVERLGWFNRQHIKRVGPEELAALVAPYLLEEFGATTRSGETELSDTDWRDQFLSAAAEEMVTLSDVVELARPLFEDAFPMSEEAGAALQSPIATDVLTAFAAGLSELHPFDYDAINAYLKALRYRFKIERGIAGKEVMFPIRAALTGSLKGPCLVVLIMLIGRARSLARARVVLQGLPS